MSSKPVLLLALTLIAVGCDDGGLPATPDGGAPLADSGNDRGVPDLAGPADATVADRALPSDAFPADAEPSPAAPRFSQVGRFAVTLGATGDPADVYHPAPGDLSGGSYAFPVVVLLQGAKVDKRHYSQVARAVARHGFVVVVPNHASLLGLFTAPKVITAALQQMNAEAADASSPLAGAIDTSTLGLIGHSYGGVVGLYAIQELCRFPFCVGSFQRPAELKAGAFYGTNMKPPVGPIPQVANAGIAVALIQGELDSKSKLADTKITYDKIETPPKALVTLTGANHYGVCNTNNPTGADPDPVAPTLPQSVAVETVARWSALFLRAHLLGETAAKTYVHQSGAALDPNASVTSVE